MSSEFVDNLKVIMVIILANRVFINRHKPRSLSLKFFFLTRARVPTHLSLVFPIGTARLVGGSARAPKKKKK